jgi:hypothetical protein
MPGSPGDTELYEAYGPRFLAKAAGFVPWAQGLPFVWFEDEAEEKAAAARLASQPHLVVLVDPAVGLTSLRLDEAARWLLALGEGA